MSVVTVAGLLDVLERHGLLTAEQLKEGRSLQARLTEPRQLARELIQRAWLTPYQVNQLFLGRAADLVMGPIWCWNVSARAAPGRSSRPATFAWIASSPSS